MFKSRKKEIEELKQRILSQALTISEQTAVILEVKRRIASGLLLQNGQNPFSQGYMAAMERIEASFNSRQRIGKARQRSIATRYDGSQVGKRLSSDEIPK